jgi:hypothetical protein
VAIVALHVWVQVGQVVAAAMGRVAVVMQTAVSGGAYRGVKRLGLRGSGRRRESNVGMGRDVKNGMTPFTNFESFFFCVGVGVGVGVAFAWAFAFACHVHAQGKHFQGKCSGACFFAAVSLVGQCYTLSRVESPGMMCTAGAKLIPRKQHTKLTGFVARVSIAQWSQPFLSLCVRSTPFIDDAE